MEDATASLNPCREGGATLSTVTGFSNCADKALEKSHGKGLSAPIHRTVVLWKS